MGQTNKKRQINWHIGIPVALWIAILTLGIIKISLKTDWAHIKDNIDCFISDLITSFNGSTFSAFISVIVCMLYQHFSTEKEAEKEAVSGLSMSHMPFTIISTLIYGSAAIFDAAINHIAMAVLFLLINIIYVVCFFKIFLAPKK